VYKILSKKKRQQDRNEIGAIPFLVLNKCTKYCKKRGIRVQNIVKKKGKKRHKCTKYYQKKKAT